MFKKLLLLSLLFCPGCAVKIYDAYYLDRKFGQNEQVLYGDNKLKATVVSCTRTGKCIFKYDIIAITEDGQIWPVEDVYEYQLKKIEK